MCAGRCSTCTRPLWVQEEDNKRWEDVEALLANRKHTVFAGHVHHYVKYERNNGKYFTLATTGGGSPLRNPTLGEFDHVVWVTMTDNGPILANLLLNGIWDENITTEKMAELGRPLASGFPIAIEPILRNNAHFTGGPTQIRLTNDSDGLMEVDLQLIGSPDLYPDFGQQHYTIQPNSVERVSLNLTPASQARSIDQTEPVQLKAQFKYKFLDVPEVTFEKIYLIRPEVEEEIAKVAQPVKVDGDLKEWGNLPFRVEEARYIETDPFSHKGANDASFSFATAYDDQFLYVAVKVKDDELVTDPNKWPNEQDAVFVHIDARPERISANSLGGWREGLFLAQIPDLSSQRQEKFFNQQNLPEGIKGITVQTKEGMVSEMAIPLDYIKKTQGTEDWTTLRLNVYYSDADQNGQHHSMLFWKPAWNGQENYVGSGMFRKRKEF
ncbi:MAG: hypothetical protein HC880_05370 [Bacteroidia bacterium]|nr:hypothetical protein [Bacteroidia bacterium]